jgi:hypothetical protein
VSGSTRAARLLAGSALLLIPVGVTAGCSATNPSPIASPYTAGDGTNGEIRDPATGTVIKLRNFLVVSAGKGQPGQLVGAIANEGSGPVQIGLTIESPASAGSAAASASPALASAAITAAPGQLTLIGPGGAAVDVTALPAIPGATVTLRAQTGAGGELLSIPVVAATGQYASLSAGSPAPAPSGSPTAG